MVPLPGVLPLVLPLPPSDNHAHRIGQVRGHACIVLTPGARAWREEAQWTMKIWRRAVGWTVPERGSKVIAAITIWWPDRRVHDSGNLIKELADAIKGILVVDDQWLLPRIMDWDLDRQHPRVVVALSCLVTAESKPAENTRSGTL